MFYNYGKNVRQISGKNVLLRVEALFGEVEEMFLTFRCLSS